MGRYESDYRRRRMGPGMGSFGPEYRDELYGGGDPNRWGVRGGAGRPGGYGRDYPAAYPEHRGRAPGGYGRDDRDSWNRGYGWDYRTGPHPGRRGFGGGRTAEGYRGPGTDLGEDIARGYVGRWRDPRQGFHRGPGHPGRGRW